MATCGGGLWKTTNSGVNWKCVTDGFLGVGTVGAVEVSKSNPDIVVIGTGERDIRGNISHGDGCYKSMDGGKTWSHIGLRETQTISRIVIHPKNPDIMWVAALGHIYGPNKERGIYKTTDGGKTWKNVLFESDIAGACDISVDQNDPNTLFASTWEAWRNPYHLNSGGQGSKLWKSTDGGESWADISQNSGMPSGVLGKIGVSISPVNSQTVYALIEAKKGGIYRSNDGGKTWSLTNEDHEFTQRAWYYMRIVADPKEEKTVYVLNTGLFRSKDGGATFRGINSQHGDEHDLWIDPSDNKRMINSDDGGSTVSVDGGQSWTPETFPTGQFYHVSTDNSWPYKILGAQQDSSTVRIASRTSSGGIGRADWTATAGGESGYVVADPRDPNIVLGGNYGGELAWSNHATGLARSINVWPDNPMGHGAIDSKYRFQWTYPIVFSIHNPGVIYTCSQYVHKTTNLGESWAVISPDLTRNDPKTLISSGGPLTQDNTGVEYYATVFTLAESPIKKGLLWAGSDDGLVHVTTNEGKTWKDVTPKQKPKWGLCSMIDASSHSVGRAYLAVDNHENDDYAPYCYRTDDFGLTWIDISKGLPKNTFVRVVREDPIRMGMLYCGTENGVYLSYDAGEHWAPLQLNLPITPIHDIVVKDSDLVLASHGRGFWVLDDLYSLREADKVSSRSAFLFDPKPIYRVIIPSNRGRNAGGAPAPINEELGENPLSGNIIEFFLPKESENITFVVTDKNGVKVANTTVSKGIAGLNRTTISNLRYQGFRTFPGMIFWAGFSQSIQAPPGNYSLSMTVDGQTLTRPLLVTVPEGATYSNADLVAQFELASKISSRINEANDAIVIIRDLRKKLQGVADSDSSFKKLIDEILIELTNSEETIYQTKSMSGQDPLNFPIRLNDKLAGLLTFVNSGNFKPAAQAYEVFQMLSKQLEVPLKAFQRCINVTLPELNKALKSKNLATIEVIDPAKQKT